MSRIEVLVTDEIEATSEAGDAHIIVEYSTVHITAKGNSPVQSRTASKSYKLRSGMYVNRSGFDSFEVIGSGMKLTRV